MTYPGTPTTPKTKNKFYGHAACFECPSSDGLSVYEDSMYCHVCAKHFSYKDHERPATIKYGPEHTKGNKMEKTTGPAKGQPPKSLTDRKLSQATLEHYGVTLSYDSKGLPTKHHYPYFNARGEHIATKTRIVAEKDFFCSGLIGESQLFGQNVLAPGGKYVTITEGEIDAMSHYEMMKYPAVSVKNATTALADCRAQYDYLNTFETIVLAFDKDEAKVRNDGTKFYPGQDAAKAIAQLFKGGKVKVMDMGIYKDANDFLKANDKKTYERRWYDAPVFTQDGIVAGSALWEAVSREDKHTSTPYPWAGLNKKLYGFRTSEMVVVTAGTGVGKTTLLKAIAVWMKDHIPKDANIGGMFLEETLGETGKGLMSIQLGRPLHLPDTVATIEEKRKAFDETLGSGRFYFHDHFGSTSIDNIIDKAHKLISQYDCKYLILDHISIVVSDQQNGDERKALDEIATKLKTLCLERDVALFIVCHLKRINGKPAEEGGQISLSDLRGTAGIGQLANVVLGLERDVQAGDGDNLVRIRVLKNRFAGKAGVACELEFDYETFSYKEVEAVSDVPNNSFVKQENTHEKQEVEETNQDETLTPFRAQA